MIEFNVMAEGGSVRIFNSSLAVQFNGGSGDGSYRVIIDDNRSWPEKGSLWRFVDSFHVAAPGVHLSAEDWADTPIYEFPRGRWLVNHQRDGRLVHIERGFPS